MRLTLSWWRRLLRDKARLRGVYTLEKFRVGATEPYEVKRFCNIALNEGIQRVLDLAIGAGGTTYSNANARIGVGTGTTTPQPTDSGLAGGTTYYQAMDGGYPSRSSQTLTFRITVADGDAEFAWAECVVQNGAVAHEHLSRVLLVPAETKSPGEVWRLTYAFTMG